MGYTEGDVDVMPIGALGWAGHRWLWSWSEDLQKAFVVDFNGFEVIPPVLDEKTARLIVSEHNDSIRRAWDHVEIEEINE